MDVEVCSIQGNKADEDRYSIGGHWQGKDALREVGLQLSAFLTIQSTN